MVGALKCVDKVLFEDSWEQKRQDVIDNNIDIFVMGDDWKGQFDYLKDICEVVYLPRTDGISSTDLRHERAGREIVYGSYQKPFSLSIKDWFSRKLKSCII